LAKSCTAHRPTTHFTHTTAPIFHPTHTHTHTHNINFGCNLQQKTKKKRSEAKDKLRLRRIKITDQKRVKNIKKKIAKKWVKYKKK